MDHMDKAYFAEKLVTIFPSAYEIYQAHIDDYGEILEHLFFADAINPTLAALLKDNKDKALIQKYIDFIEEMYSDGDEAVRNVVVVTILAYLGDDDTVLKNAYKYLSETLIVQSKLEEHFLGRREVKISYRKGKVTAAW